MTKQVQLRRGTTAEHAAFTGALGEITFDTDKNALIIHDGVTAGGFELQRVAAMLTSLAGLSDPNADRALFWDDSAGQLDWLILGANLAITDKTLDVTGGITDTFATVKIDNVVENTAAPTLDFNSAFFAITESPVDEFNIEVNLAGIDHNAITNYIANEHIDHSTVTISAGNGLTGGGDITANRSIALNIAGQTEELSPDGANDLVIIHHAASGNFRKVKLDNLPGSGGSGEANTASNQGAGVGVFDEKTGVDLEFRSLIAASSKITITLDDVNDEIDFDVNEAALTITEAQISDLNHVVDFVSNVATSTILGRVTAGSGNSEELTAAQVRTLINVEDGATADQTAGEIEAIVNHDNLLGFIANEHIDWTGDAGASNIHVNNIVNLTTANLASANVSQFTNDAGYITATLTQEEVEDYVGAMVGVGSVQTLITVSYDDVNGFLDFVVDEASINHDALTNFVANEHIDHTSVTLTAGAGLTGGGDISANRTFDVDINGQTADASPDGAADYVLTHDADAGTLKKVLLNNLPSGGGGEINTASNLGAGIGVFDGKVGVDLQFRSLVSQSLALSVALDAVNDEVDLTINGFAIESVPGTAPVATGTDAIAIGDSAVAQNVGEIAECTGQTKAQKLTYLCTAQTTDATPTKINPDNQSTTNRLILPTNTAWAFLITAVAKRNTGVFLFHAEYRGVIGRHNGSMGISSIFEDIIVDSIGVGGLTISSDPPNSALEIEVTGKAAATIRWTAKVEITEVQD